MLDVFRLVAAVQVSRYRDAERRQPSPQANMQHIAGDHEVLGLKLGDELLRAVLLRPPLVLVERAEMPFGRVRPGDRRCVVDRPALQAHLESRASGDTTRSLGSVDEHA